MNSKIKLVAFGLMITLATTARASDPRPIEAPDPVTVTGSRIRSFGLSQASSKIKHLRNNLIRLTYCGNEVLGSTVSGEQHEADKCHCIPSRRFSTPSL